MRQLITIFLAGAALLGAVSCKTSEENYRAAYEKTIAGRDSLASLESTIYGAQRRNMGSRTAVAGSDTAEVRTARVKVTEGGGGINENLKPYSVVVGQFKQVFNARSMRERLADSGYPQAFVVETAEPYYYIILASYPTQAEAIHALAAIPADFPVAMKSPVPFVLRAAGIGK